MESKAIPLQKICSGHQNERSALGCVSRLFIACNILIGSVTHVAGKFVTWTSFTSSLKLQLHPRQVPQLRAANIPLTRWTKLAQHGENQNPSVSICGQLKSPSIEGSTSATKGKSRKCLSFSLLEKIKKLKALLYFDLKSTLAPEVRSQNT